MNVRREAQLMLQFKVTGERKNTEFVIVKEPIFFFFGLTENHVSSPFTDTGNC